MSGSCSPTSPPGEGALTRRCVTTLRPKIETDPHRPAYIQTVRDIGYRFEA